MKGGADRTQRYTKIEVIVYKIFFVDRNDKEDIPEPMEDWEKAEPEDQEYWDDTVGENCIPLSRDTCCTRVYLLSAISCLC